MSARSTAGVALEDPWGWFREVLAAGYRPGIVATAAHVALAVHGDTLAAAPGVSHLARRTRQHRDYVGVHLAQLADDGYLDPGPRARGRGGAKTVLRLALPSLLRVSEVEKYARDPGRIRPDYAPDPGPIGADVGLDDAPDSGPIGREYAPDPGPVSPPTPPPVSGGEGNLPLPTSPQRRHRQSPIVAALPGGLSADQRTEAEAVLQLLPTRLWPKSPGWRSTMLELLAGLLAEGWTAAEIKQRAAEDLPGDVIRYPVSFVEKRFKGLTPPRRHVPQVGRPEYCSKPEHSMQPLPCRGCRVDELERQLEEAEWAEEAG